MTHVSKLTVAAHIHANPDQVELVQAEVTDGSAANSDAGEPETATPP
jgi:hypothetical protein